MISKLTEEFVAKATHMAGACDVSADAGSRALEVAVVLYSLVPEIERLI